MSTRQLRLCFIADGRSPTARRWIVYFATKGHDVLLLSTWDCDSIEGVNVAALSRSGSSLVAESGKPSLRRLGRLGRSAYYRLGRLGEEVRFRFIAPRDVRRLSVRLSNFVSSFEPDLVHALRLPSEGYIAGAANFTQPLVVSVWGNDFTYFAKRWKVLERATRRTLSKTALLFADAGRDLLTAKGLGLPDDARTVRLPGCGGIDRTVFHPPDSRSAAKHTLGFEEHSEVVTYPRRLRPGSVMAMEFFRAAVALVHARPRLHGVCPGLQGSATVERWTKGIDRIHLWQTLDARAMARLFQASEVVVSPSIHDGMPNSVLEAMACGAIPVVGDIESLREWIPDEGAVFCNAKSELAILEGVTAALDEKIDVRRARALNYAAIDELVDYEANMKQAEELYRDLVEGRHRRGQ